MKFNVLMSICDVLMVGGTGLLTFTERKKIQSFWRNLSLLVLKEIKTDKQGWTKN